MNEKDKINHDKRSVFTDALETLGKIIDDTQERDAIHLAVEPVKAKEILYPGQHVSANGDTLGKAVGIVDPFLKSEVNIGQCFWLVIYHREIKSLRHIWTHPDFPDRDTKIIESKKWIEDFINEIKGQDEDDNEKVALTYDIIMNAAYEYLDTSFPDPDNAEYLNLGPLLYGIKTPSEFWDHFYIITKRKKPDNLPEDFFSCSC